MSETKIVCIYDNNKACPVCMAIGMRIPVLDLARQACPICPIRLDMLPKSS
ncbi:MAG TPA: hypothetical protein VJ249_01620 [Candidatus Bathyarchaeia archaeon]|nr:hypothetical protein [Candidatus Bathyarchaeia archaeon]